MDRKTYYVTTPIYYPSGKFHIGNTYTTIFANTMKKYKEKRGYDTYFLTGLDEHGQKIGTLAQEQNKTPQEYVDGMAEYAKGLWKKMNIEYDDFIRTTEERHTKVVEEIFESDYEMKRPFIAKKGTVIENQIDRINEFVRSNEIVSIDSILDFVSDNRLHLYSISEYVDSLEDYVFKDDKSIIELEKSGINKYNVEVVEKMILKAMKDEDFIFADRLPFYNLFPKEVKWTPWLIYSALNKLGIYLKVIPSDTIFRRKNVIYARPLIIRRQIKATNINEFIEYLKDKKQMNDTEFYKYLRTKGLTE